MVTVPRSRVTPADTCVPRWDENTQQAAHHTWRTCRWLHSQPPFDFAASSPFSTRCRRDSILPCTISDPVCCVTIVNVLVRQVCWYRGHGDLRYLRRRLSPSGGSFCLNEGLGIVSPHVKRCVFVLLVNLERMICLPFSFREACLSHVLSPRAGAARLFVGSLLLQVVAHRSLSATFEFRMRVSSF